MSKPRVGVFVCQCGSNIAATVDTQAVAKFAEGLDGVVLARVNKYTCSDPGQATIRNDIKEYNLDRVVVAACTPRMHEPTFRRTLESAGLNPYYLEIANIREQVSWVHAPGRSGHQQGQRPGCRSCGTSATAPGALLAQVARRTGGSGGRCRHRRHPGSAGHGRRRLQGLPGGTGAELSAAGCPNWTRPSPPWTVPPEFWGPK